MRLIKLTVLTAALTSASVKAAPDSQLTDWAVGIVCKSTEVKTWNKYNLARLPLLLHTGLASDRVLIFGAKNPKVRATAFVCPNNARIHYYEVRKQDFTSELVSVLAEFLVPDRKLLNGNYFVYDISFNMGNQADRKRNAAESFLVLFHEYFHFYQEQFPVNKLFGDTFADFNTNEYLNTQLIFLAGVENHLLQQLENISIPEDSAVKVSTDKFRAISRDYFAVRKSRRSLLSPKMAISEMHKESIEGSAAYVEHNSVRKVIGEVLGISKGELLKKERREIRYFLSNDEDNILANLTGFGRFYKAFYTIARIFSQYPVDNWTARVNQGEDLAEILKDFLGPDSRTADDIIRQMDANVVEKIRANATRSLEKYLHSIKDAQEHLYGNPSEPILMDLIVSKSIEEGCALGGGGSSSVQGLDGLDIVTDFSFFGDCDAGQDHLAIKINNFPAGAIGTSIFSRVKIAEGDIAYRDQQGNEIHKSLSKVIADGDALANYKSDFKLTVVNDPAENKVIEFVSNFKPKIAVNHCPNSPMSIAITWEK
jgi:hypothetical protein